MEFQASISEIDECLARIRTCLGPCLQESVYRNALQFELSKRGHVVVPEVVIPYIYEGVVVGHGRADLILYQKGATATQPFLIIELKVQRNGGNINRKSVRGQLLNYMKHMDCKNGCTIIIKHQSPGKINQLY